MAKSPIRIIGICINHYFTNVLASSTVELSNSNYIISKLRNLCLEPNESGKETGKDGAGKVVGRDYAGGRKSIY